MIVPILAYHAVTDDPPAWIAPFAVSPAAFGAQLDAVADSGRTPITVSGYIDGLAGLAPLPEQPVLITIDDGFADFASNALPALASRGICSTLYVTTGALADVSRDTVLPEAPMLRTSDLAGIEAAGVEIGAHSQTHRQLDLLPEGAVAAELAQCAGALADSLGHRVRSFAYPHGYWRPTIRRLVSAAGFDSACAVGNALSTERDDPLTLSRIFVRADTAVATLAGWLHGSGARTGQPGRMLPFGWRQVRRVRALLGGSFAG